MDHEAISQNQDQLTISKRKRTRRHKSTSSIDQQQHEEDMVLANCLILLAQGHGSSSPSLNYQCKTCDRFFSSFQALGGHRASHKKPKPDQLGDHDHDHDHNTTLSLQTSNTCISVSACNNNSGFKSKVHECTICGAEFSSGQALGGHMRRHRSILNTHVRPINLAMAGTPGDHIILEPQDTDLRLCLDLNLPPSSTEGGHNIIIQREPMFPSLVDCHY